MLDTFDFLSQYKNVVEWNAVARNGVHVFSHDAIVRQSEYTRSEIQETLDAIAADDSVEFLDGVADIFVTMTYKHFLAQNGDVDDAEIVKAIEFMSSEGVMTYENDHELARTHLKEIADIVMIENQSPVFDTSSLCALIELMNLTELYYDVNVMDVVKHIMDSNWSKFPKVSQTNVEKEVAYIAAKNPDFKDFVGTVNEASGVVVYRTDNGVGKIMKPSTFWNANCQVFL
jgi:hypothetical protein